jgi:proteic killer suppression protein
VVQIRVQARAGHEMGEPAAVLIDEASDLWAVLPERPISHLDNCHVTRYNHCMIKTFADRETQQLFTTGKSRRLPPDLVKRAVRRLEYIDLANELSGLKVPPSNRLHALKDDREGQYAISINDQWRICFRFMAGDAYDVEITDYH